MGKLNTELFFYDAIDSMMLSLSQSRCTSVYLPRAPFIKTDSWWRYEMETVSALVSLFEENPPVTGGIPSQRASSTGFDIFFGVSRNKRLNKQSSRQWFQTPWSPLWRHRNFNGDYAMNKLLHLCFSVACNYSPMSYPDFSSSKVTYISIFQWTTWLRSIWNVKRSHRPNHVMVSILWNIPFCH